MCLILDHKIRNIMKEDEVCKRNRYETIQSLTAKLNLETMKKYK